MNGFNTPGNADWMPDFEDPEKPQRLDRFCPSDATACSPSSTPETESEWERKDLWRPIDLANAMKAKCRRLEIERNELRAWIMQAAPMLSTASCIVIDEAVERLGEIEGCRAVLELCPVDFINPENH